MLREKILITVRTYPTISKSYLETVCTAGITEAGQWYRLYPVPLRYLDSEQQYHVWDWIKVSTKKSTSDNRPESRNPNCNTLEIIGKVEEPQTKYDLVAPTCFSSVASLADAGRSIGAVEVAEVLEYSSKPTDEHWTAKQMDSLKQEDLWNERKPLEKIPFEFHVTWRDLDGVEHRSMIIEWEFMQTWRNFRGRYGTDALSRTLDKWREETNTAQRKVFFFLGNHSRWRETFMLCGTMRVDRRKVTNESLF